jgi:hypothetical protein
MMFSEANRQSNNETSNYECDYACNYAYLITPTRKRRTIRLDRARILVAEHESRVFHGYLICHFGKQALQPLLLCCEPLSSFLYLVLLFYRPSVTL